jgi:hypothetical protein
MRSILLISALTSFALTSPAANAAHLSCSNDGNLPNSDLVGYDFTVSVPVSNVGSGGGAGKVTTSLVVTLPVNASLVPLGTFVSNGHHSSVCTLTEPGSGFELAMHDVVFSKLEILNGPNVAGKTTTVAELSLAYASETFTTAP